MILPNANADSADSVPSPGEIGIPELNGCAQKVHKVASKKVIKNQSVPMRKVKSITHQPVSDLTFNALLTDSD
jgi:hypothetical protein